MKGLVTIDALGCLEETEIEISVPSFVHGQVSYDYEVLEEDDDLE